MNNPNHHNKMTSIKFDNLSSIITTRGVDTLMISKILRQLNFTEEQAEVFSEIVKQTNLNAEQIMSEKISEHSGKLATKRDLKELELKIETVRSDLEAKLANVKSDLIKWVAGLMIANTGLLFTLIKFFNQ